MMRRTLTIALALGVSACLLSAAAQQKELGDAPLPEGVKLDSHSFAPQIKGEKSTPRKWPYVELNGKSFARDARFKLTNGGELYDLSEAPYKEIAVSSTTTDAAAIAARQQLEEVLKQHPTAPGGPNKQAARAGKKKARKKS